MGDENLCANGFQSNLNLSALRNADEWNEYDMEWRGDIWWYPVVWRLFATHLPQVHRRRPGDPGLAYADAVVMIIAILLLILSGTTKVYSIHINNRTSN